MLIRTILKSSVVLFGLFQLASPATLRCFYSTLTDFQDVPVDSPGGLVNGSRPCVDITKPTIVFACGYKYLEFGPLVTAVITALLSLNTYNVMMVNWVEEAGDGGKGDLGYLSYCLPNSQKLGKLLGQGLADLVMNHNVNPNITTLAHSAGCTLVCVAGNKYALITGNPIPQSIIMDPARLGFEPPSFYKVPDKTCAHRVMSSHCDPGGYGMKKTEAHVNFWLNYKYFASIFSSKLQPGCTKANTTQEALTNGNRCNHDYCWKTFVQAVYRTATFTGGLADNYAAAVAANGNFLVTNDYGLDWNTEKQGNFFMRASANEPYGLGADGLQDP